MDRWLIAAEDAEYARWLTSSSLSTHDRNDEMLIAFKMAKRLSIPPTRVISASHGQKGQADRVLPTNRKVAA